VRDAGIFYDRGNTQNVTAHRIADFDCDGGVRELPRVSGILEVIENLSGEHLGEYGKRSWAPQPEGRTSANDAEPVDGLVALARYPFCSGLILFRWQEFFVDGGDDDIVGVDHFGQMDFAYL